MSLDSLSSDLVLHILDSRDADDPGGYSMLQLQEVARLGACSRSLRSVVGVWATTPSAYGGAFRRWVEEEADPLAAWTGGAPLSFTAVCGDGGVLAAAARRPRKRSRLPISPVRGG